VPRSMIRCSRLKPEDRWLFEKISSQLIGDEVVHRHVVVERANDPVAIGCHLAIVVVVQAVGIGKANEVKPIASHMLAIGGALDQAVD